MNPVLPRVRLWFRCGREQTVNIGNKRPVYGTNGRSKERTAGFWNDSSSKYESELDTPAGLKCPHPTVATLAQSVGDPADSHALRERGYRTSQTGGGIILANLH